MHAMSGDTNINNITDGVNVIMGELISSALPVEFQLFTCFVVIVIGLHACVDALCTISALFHAPRLRCFTTLYPSLFLHSYVRDDPLIGRLVVYAAAAMSLVRVMAVVTPFNVPVMLLVGVMYLLEALICLYEMDTAHSANAMVAGRAIVSALFMVLVTWTHALLSWVFVY